MKILSTSDNHVGFRQYGLLSREKDIENSFRRVLEKGVSLGVDAITISGDIIHTVRPTASSIQFLKKCQDYLVENNTLCLVSIGNHDKSSPHWISNLSNDNGSGFKVLDDETYILKNEVAVYGKTFCSKEEFDQGKCIPKTTDFLLMHQSFNELTNFPSDKSFTFEDFNYVPGSVVIIGDTHIHRRYTHNTSEGHTIEICSPGSTELLSEPEEDVKFVYLCEYKDSAWSIESVPINTRQVRRIEIKEDSDIEKAVSTIKDDTSNPIVYVSFNTELQDVLGRIRKQVDTTKMVLRPKPMRLDVVDQKMHEVEKDITISDLLKEFIPNNPTQFETVSQLLNQDAEVHGVLDTFIEKRLKELTDLNE